MTDPTILMNYLIKKFPDATIKDWFEALREIEGEKDRKPERWLVKSETNKKQRA